MGRVSSSAELDQRVAVGSQKTFEKVLSKLSKKSFLKHSNSDLSVSSPSGDCVRHKITPPVPSPPGGPGKLRFIGEAYEKQNRSFCRLDLPERAVLLLKCVGRVRA